MTQEIKRPATAQGNLRRTMYYGSYSVYPNRFAYLFLKERTLTKFHIII